MTNREDELLANIGQPVLDSNNPCSDNDNPVLSVNNHITINCATGTTNSNSNSNSTSAVVAQSEVDVLLLKAALEPNQNEITINGDSINTTTAVSADTTVAATVAAANIQATNSTSNGTNVEACDQLVINGVSGSESSGGEFWSENPPSSASSGFSDDDSLAGAEGDPKTIEQIVQMVKERGKSGLVKEYHEIRSRAPTGTFLNARHRNNVSKNRYTDVLCYDHSRVVLSKEGDDEFSDYINANFVDGYKQKNAYISTQGPLTKTFRDFWRMIWEQHCLVIVMTTRVTERGRIKCGQYWDPSADGTMEFGNFQVRTISVDTHEDHTVTSLELKNTKTDEVRNVSHWQFTSWPDYGVPSTAMTMLNFLQNVRDKQAQMVTALGDTWAGHARGPPIVVHCSAGIGRTGTFITLDICISRLEDVGNVDIRGTVEKIRAQRAYSIQMPDQYVFCHIALIEYAISRGMLRAVDLGGLEVNLEDSD